MVEAAQVLDSGAPHLGIFGFVQKVKASYLRFCCNQLDLNWGEHGARSGARHTKGDENISLHGHSPRH